MNKTTLKLFAVGIALTSVGLLFLLSPRKEISCSELGQIIIGMLLVLISLMIVNILLRIKSNEKN